MWPAEKQLLGRIELATLRNQAVILLHHQQIIQLLCLLQATIQQQQINLSISQAKVLTQHGCQAAQHTQRKQQTAQTAANSQQP